MQRIDKRIREIERERERVVIANDRQESLKSASKRSQQESVMQGNGSHESRVAICSQAQQVPLWSTAASERERDCVSFVLTSSSSHPRAAGAAAAGRSSSSCHSEACERRKHSTVRSLCPSSDSRHVMNINRLSEDVSNFTYHKFNSSLHSMNVDIDVLQWLVWLLTPVIVSPCLPSSLLD